MIEQLFLRTPSVEVWPTFENRVLSQLDKNSPAKDSFTSRILSEDTYDNYFRFENGATSFISIETVHNLIRLQLDGRTSGDLLVGGQENVFYCQSIQDGHPGFAIKAQWLERGDKEFRWLVLGWSLCVPGIWPDWGSFRSAGTKVFW